MSEVVSEVIKREKKQKLRKQYPISALQTTLYRRSYEVSIRFYFIQMDCSICNDVRFVLKLQESLKRPISGSDFGYEIPLKDVHCSEMIMLKEELSGEQTTDIDADTSDVDR